MAVPLENSLALFLCALVFLRVLRYLLPSMGRSLRRRFSGAMGPHIIVDSLRPAAAGRARDCVAFDVDEVVLGAGRCAGCGGGV